MATLPPPASPFDPVLEIEHGTVDAKACVNAFYVAISEKSYDADDSGPGATRDKVLLATVTEDALRMFPINVRRGVADYLKPRHDNLRTITIEQRCGGGAPRRRGVWSWRQARRAAPAKGKGPTIAAPTARRGRPARCGGTIPRTATTTTP